MTAYGFDRQSVELIRQVVLQVLGEIPGVNSSRTTTVLPTLWRLAKTTETVTAGNSTTVNIYTGTTKGSESANGETVDAYVRFGDLVNDTWVLVGWVNGGWEVVQAECE